MGYYIYLGPWRILFFPNNHFLRFVCLIQQISHTCCNCVKKCFRHNWINVSQIVPPSSTGWFDPFMNKEAFLIFCHVLLNFINTTFNFQNSLIFDFVHVIPIKTSFTETISLIFDILFCNITGISFYVLFELFLR